MAFTPEFIQSVHSAMEASCGSAVNAAKALGVNSIVVWNCLHKVPELRIRWTKSKENKKSVDQKAAAINKPAEPVPVSDVEALKKANARLREGFEAIGLKGDKLEQAIAIQEFAQRQVSHVMGFMSGSIAKQFVDIEAEIDEINKKLAGMVKCGQTWVAADVKLDVEEEAMLRKDRHGLYDLRIKSFDRSLRAQMAMAHLKLKAAETNGKAIKPRALGFAPVQQQRIIEQ